MRQSFAITIALGAGLAACAGPAPEIRMIQSPLSQADLPVNDRLAEGNAMMRLGNVGLAIEAYRKAKRVDPENPDVYVMLASAYDRMGRTDLALSHYEKALALAPHRPDLYVALAGTMSREGRHAAARAVLAEAEARETMLTVVEDEARALQSAQLRNHVEAQLERSEERAAVVAVAPLARRREGRTGPRLEKLARGETLLVTTEQPVWAERQDSDAIAITMSEPKAAPIPTLLPGPEPIAAVTPPYVPPRIPMLASPELALPETRATILAELRAPDVVRQALAEKVEETQGAPIDLLALVETFLLDDQLFGLLVEEGLASEAQVAQLAASRTARPVPAMHGIALCTK